MDVLLSSPYMFKWNDIYVCMYKVYISIIYIHVQVMCEGVGSCDEGLEYVAIPDIQYQTAIRHHVHITISYSEKRLASSTLRMRPPPA